MKTCIACFFEHQRPRAPRCWKCEKGFQQEKFMQKHKEKFDAYQKKYREENKHLLSDRSKRSREKNPAHYKNLQLKQHRLRNGLPEDYMPKPRRKAGEGNINKQGYKRISKPSHPNAQSSGVILEHIWVMSEHIGRPLYRGETVHHINGDRLDNSIENLQLWNSSHPPGQRVEDKIKWAIDFLNQYGYQVIEPSSVCV